MDIIVLVKKQSFYTRVCYNCSIHLIFLACMMIPVKIKNNTVIVVTIVIIESYLSIFELGLIKRLIMFH